MEDFFVRYARPLDTAEQDVAFSRLWAVLEKLVDVGADHEKLIKRVLFLCSAQDRGFANAVLQHLRHVRNNIVHFDKSPGRPAVYIYQLKSFVDMAMAYHLSEGRRFDSLTAAAQLLDLPADPGSLAECIRVYRHALHVRSRLTTQ